MRLTLRDLPPDGKGKGRAGDVRHSEKEGLVGEHGVFKVEQGSDFL